MVFRFFVCFFLKNCSLRIFEDDQSISPPKYWWTPYASKKFWSGALIIARTLLTLIFETKLVFLFFSSVTYEIHKRVIRISSNLDWRQQEMVIEVLEDFFILTSKWGPNSSSLGDFCPLKADKCSEFLETLAYRSLSIFFFFISRKIAFTLWPQNGYYYPHFILYIFLYFSRKCFFEFLEFFYSFTWWIKVWIGQRKICAKGKPLKVGVFTDRPKNSFLYVTLL